MNQDINRLLMEVEHNVRRINREVINPEIVEIGINGLLPVLSLVAQARARYLKALFDLGATVTADRPTEAQFQELAQLRTEFDELLQGAQALETAIQRGYIDVLSNGN